MPSNEQHPKVALACDWLTTPGGAEKVLLELHRMYPDAPIYTSQYRPKKITWFSDADVRTGWLNFFPAALRKVLGPLRQLYFSRLDLSDYDLVISVTGAEAKSIRTAPKKSLSSHYSTHTHKSQDINPKPPKKTAPEAKNCPNSTLKSSPQLAPTPNSAPEASEAQTDCAHRAKHLCYCHVPTQYYWQLYDQYVKNPGFGPLNPFVRLCFKLLIKPLRKADYAAAQKPDQFITISSYAADQIKKYYHRDAVIIAPPVETSKFSTKIPNLSTTFPQDFHHQDATSPHLFHRKDAPFPQKEPHFSTKSSDFSTKNRELSTEHPHFSTTFPQDFHKHQYFVIACRQVTWKRVDLAISACLQAKVPLAVIGDGSERQNLLRLAGDSPHIRFIPWLDSSELAFYLQNAKAYLFPSLEPFGIAAVEALAAGCPVIAYAAGGSRDFITPGKNGLLFPEESHAQASNSSITEETPGQTPEALAAAIRDFSRYKFNPETVSKSASRFDVQNFRREIQSLVDQTLSTSDFPASSKPHNQPNPENHHD